MMSTTMAAATILAGQMADFPPRRVLIRFPSQTRLVFGQSGIVS